MKKNKVYIDQDLETLIPQYLDNREEDIRRLKTLIEAENYEKIRIIGHSLKGSGGGYGFDYLTELGSQIEKNAELKNREDIELIINKLENYLDNLEIIYQED
ncbi:Hpt domain-containing protein [Halanaerobium kushneri]|uniref:Hpt domain-containing protein n=1 Tax=Halanaerobium kushneri TaxID=56779 RepID=A0A1N6ZRP8_9FIRM|nr:Hpt domain-containing protein [Halanaerobium kushneri]KXS49772.1 MAG: Hpt protein [Halanaerobium sp. T82-1]PUU89155.1 MAG: Hpt protein [Halanaerobium sp.]SIR29401.1 Hpt domain-containing protein [Halanaerobium kushneri]